LRGHGGVGSESGETGRSSGTGDEGNISESGDAPDTGVPGDSEGTSESGRASGNGQSSNGGAPSDNTKRHHSGNGLPREGEKTEGSRGPEEPESHPESDRFIGLVGRYTLLAQHYHSQHAAVSLPSFQHVQQYGVWDAAL
jgi:hypothetical protein